MEYVDTEAVKAKVDQGSYFIEARGWYGTIYHMPLAERTVYIVVIILSAITAYMGYDAYNSVYPIMPRMPFVMISQDIMEDIPVLTRLRLTVDEDRNEAINRWFLRNYVERRESYIYDPVILERNFYNIRASSTPDVFAQYRAWYDASNGGSPFNIYGSQTSRKISIDRVALGAKHAKVIFTEILAGSAKSKPKKWVAEVGFEYKPYEVEQDIQELSMTNFFGIAVDVYLHPEKYHNKEGFHIKPMSFVVSSYNSNPYISE